MSGIGDIILTCVSKSSRNYNFGLMLGEGKKIKGILNKSKQVTEGAENIKVVYFLKKKYKVNMPILESIYKVLVKDFSIDNAVKKLLSRPQSYE